MSDLNNSFAKIYFVFVSGTALRFTSVTWVMKYGRAPAPRVVLEALLTYGEREESKT